jgi:hypothetical protein
MGNADTKKEYFFCWVRVVDVASLVTPTPPPPPLPTVSRGQALLAAEPAFADATISTSWGVPVPSAIAARPTALLASNGRNAPPKRSEGAWSVCESVYGRDGADTVFDFGPAFLKEEDAKVWLASDPKGQRWDRESLNRFLMQFTYSPV